MATYQTVGEVLSGCDGSVLIINGVNGGTYIHGLANQTLINGLVQRNVSHLTLILAYDGSGNTPDVVSYAGDKTSYTTAITTGNTYITNNPV